MSELTTFNFEDLPVRTMTIDEEPYFAGIDVAKILGYQKPSNAIIHHVDDEDKTTSLIQGPGNYKTTTTFINESGLYALIFGSSLESAKKFKRWVTSEILPQLRKTGVYQIKPLTTAEQIQIIAQGNTELDERITKIETTYPIFPGEAKHLKQIINSKVSEVLRNKFNSNQNTTVKRKLYSAIYRSLYTAFQVPNYASIPRGQYARAITFLETWQPASETVYQIELILDSEAVAQ